MQGSKPERISTSSLPNESIALRFEGKAAVMKGGMSGRAAGFIDTPRIAPALSRARQEPGCPG